MSVSIALARPDGTRTSVKDFVCFGFLDGDIGFTFNVDLNEFSDIVYYLPLPETLHGADTAYHIMTLVMLENNIPIKCPADMLVAVREGMSMSLDLPTPYVVGIFEMFREIMYHPGYMWALSRYCAAGSTTSFVGKKFVNTFLWYISRWLPHVHPLIKYRFYSHHYPVDCFYEVEPIKGRFNTFLVDATNKAVNSDPDISIRKKASYRGVYDFFMRESSKKGRRVRPEDVGLFHPRDIKLDKIAYPKLPSLVKTYEALS